MPEGDESSIQPGNFSPAWRCVFRGRTVLEAEALAASLRAEGLDAVVDQPTVATMLSHALPAVAPGGVGVLVPASQAEETAAIVLEYEAQARSRAEAAADKADTEWRAREPAGPPETDLELPAPAPPSSRAIRCLWAVSVLGTALWFPLLTVCAMVYAGVLADRARRAAEPGRAVARRAWLAVGFNAALLALGVAVYATVPHALYRGLAPWGPLLTILKPYVWPF